MKVADLVELSWRGRDIVWCSHFRDCTGVVIDVQPKNVRLHNIQIMWLGGKGTVWISRTYLKVVSKG